MDPSPIKPSRGKARGRPSLPTSTSDKFQGLHGIRPVYPTPVPQQPVQFRVTGIQRPPRVRSPIPAVSISRKNDSDHLMPGVSNTYGKLC